MIPPKEKNPEPKKRQIIAPHKRADAITSIPFEEVYSTVIWKLFILLGMAEINITELILMKKI